MQWDFCVWWDVVFDGPIPSLNPVTTHKEAVIAGPSELMVPLALSTFYVTASLK